VADPPAVGEDGSLVEDRAKAPWHFKLLLVFVVIYLGWRFIQMGGWLVHWLAG
jgi:hypothetical protein